MALNVGELFATVSIDDKPFDQGLSATEKKARSGGNRIGSSMRSGVLAPMKSIGGAIAGLVVADKVVGFFKDSIAEARESQKVGAQTTQVIKSTGAAANISAGQVGNLATAISNKTGIDDEAIQSGANMLLTFKNIRNETGKGNDIFNQATQTVTDLSVAMGTDQKDAAIQLGKALNDPIKGVTALQRVGVTFTAQQRKQIKALVDSGNTLGAQKIVLKELNSEFGGSAAAQATAGEKMSTTWKNVEESIGTALLPALDSAENAVSTKVLPAITRFIGYVVAHWPQISATISRDTAPVVAILQTAWHVIQQNRGTLESLGRTLLKIAPYIIGVGAAVVIMTSPWLLAIAAIIGVIAVYPKLRGATDAALGAVRGAWNTTIGAVRGAAASIVSAFLTMASTVVGAAAHAFGWVPGVGGKLKGAQRSIEAFRDRANTAIRGIQGEKDINIRAHDFAAPSINAYRDINGRVIATTFVDVHARTANQTGAPVPSFATGGEVHGPGGPTSDSILARVSAGEWVTDAANAKRNKDVLRAISSGRRISMAATGTGNAGIDTMAAALTHHISASGLTLKLHRSAGSVMASIVNDENAWRAGRG